MAKEKTSGDKRIRLTLDLTPKQFAKLKYIENETGESKAEIVRNALRLYTYVAERAFAGSSFHETDKRGRSKDIVFVELT
jgi:hypothetical protein